MKKYLRFSIYVLFVALMFSSCASKKNITSKSDKETAVLSEMYRHSRETFGKISKNTVDNDALSSKIKFIIEASGRDISVAGQLEMKKDKYIRIRLTPLGMFEVGMLEFTTDHVLVLDRMHKEYISADYSEVPFLKENGIDFYALQSLFRNTVFVPGESHLDAESYKKFKIHTADGKVVMSAVKGKMDYRWYVNGVTSLLEAAEISYVSGGSSSKLNCRYYDFDNVAGKQFPHKLSMHFTTDLIKSFKSLTLTVISKKIKTEQKGNGEITTVPRKYTRMDVGEIMNKILDIK